MLTARVLRLLLKGARPESILCLTFTKAAAAEMANRIGARLAAWVRLKDSELGSDLFALGERPTTARAQRARQLFAKVLDCPGGLKIQTIHASRSRCLRPFRRKRGSRRGSSRSRAGPSRSWCGGRSPICWPMPKRAAMRS